MESNEVQVLITTMNRENIEELLDTMKLNTSFVIGNQTKENGMEYYERNGNKGLIVSRNEKGVGANRNITLKYASAKYCVLADDDMIFYSGYAEKVKTAFERHPKVDVLIFNIDEDKSTRRINKHEKRVGILNYMNYGAARIAFRRTSISYMGIAFNYNFGGGAIHSAGEDSLFLRECLLHGLKVMAIPETLARLSDSRESTWFKGYSIKYLFDKGVFLAIAHPRLAYLFAIYFAVRHREYTCETKSKKETFLAMLHGIRYIKRRQM